MNGGMPGRARWAFRTALVMACALGLVAAMSGQAVAKKHKHKPKTPTVSTHTPVTKGSTLSLAR